MIAEVIRSGFVEGFHRGSVAVLDADGVLVASAGDANSAIFPRSSNKLMQAVGMLRSGLSLDDPADLALCAASHSGEPIHISRVRSMLAAGGLTESDLRTPPDLPISETARADVLRSGGGPAPVYMNCSGKHTGMLRTCVAAGWSIDDYPLPDHPLQKQIRTRRRGSGRRAGDRDRRGRLRRTGHGDFAARAGRCVPAMCHGRAR